MRNALPFLSFLLACASGCAATLPRSGLECPDAAEAKTADDGDRGRREWCEIPSGKKDCNFYSGSCEVPGTSAGPWLHYATNGTLTELAWVEEGHGLVGTRSSWYDDGTPEDRSEWIAGRREGPATHWHPNGAVAWHGDLHDDRRTGAWAAWYANGHGEWRGTYENGAPTGEWVFWNADGSTSLVMNIDLNTNVASDATWSAMKPNGRRVGLGSNGVPIVVDEWTDGVHQGTRLEFDEAGVLAKVERWMQGSVVWTWTRPKA